jgi:hypothetical protein
VIGEQFHLQLLGKFTKEKDVHWVRVDSLLHFEILDSTKVDTIRNNNLITLSQVFTLTSWDSGQWQIPSFVIGKLKTAPLKIDVAFSPSPFDVSQPYHDVKEIIEVKKPAASKWYWYLIFLVVLGVLLLLFFPREKKKVSGAFVSDFGAYGNAMKKLDELEQKQPEDPKQFYTELVQVLKEYLHRRKNIQSFSKTSEDLALQISRKPFEDEGYHQLLQTLRLSDLVKFARYHPEVSENRNSIEVMRKSIQKIEKENHAV